MVTDRVSTACLLVILSQVYRPGLVFLSLLALDISSHWLQMYSFLEKLLQYLLSRKDKSQRCQRQQLAIQALLWTCEVLYIKLFLLVRKDTGSLIDVLVNTATTSWIYLVLLALLLFGWEMKQFVNVIQVAASLVMTWIGKFFDAYIL